MQSVRVKKEHSDLFKFWLWRVSLEVWCHHDGCNYDDILQKKMINVVYVVYLKKKLIQMFKTKKKILVFSVSCIVWWKSEVLKMRSLGKKYILLKK